MGNHRRILLVVVVALCALLLNAASAAPAAPAAPAAGALQWAWARARALGASLQSDAACRSKAASCAADCGRDRVLCVQLATSRGAVWINTFNETCPKGQYCSDGSCSEVVPDTCTKPSPSSAYTCSGPGYFPDITSCTKYYFCTAGLDPYAYDCSEYPGTVYDQRSARCVPTAQVACSRLSCAHPAARLLVYAPDPRVYAICRAGSRDAADAVVIKCAGNKVINATSGVCEDGCLWAGRYRPSDAAETDDKTYIECVILAGSKMSAPTRRQCPDSSKFDESQGQCVDSASTSTDTNPDTTDTNQATTDSNTPGASP